MVVNELHLKYPEGKAYSRPSYTGMRIYNERETFSKKIKTNFIGVFLT